MSYEMNEPGDRIRNYTLRFDQEAYWSFGGENTMNRTGLNLGGMTNKLWHYNLGADYNFSHLDTRELRGGPALRIDGQYYLGAYIGSNTSKDLSAGIGFYHTGFGMKGFSQEVARMSVIWLPFRNLRLTGLLHLEQRQYHQQYVTTISGNTRDEFIAGNIDQHTSSLTFRGELFFTPELSVQYYGSPYYSVGDYDSFRRVNLASSKDIDTRLEHLDVSYDPATGNYSYDRNSETYSFADPDFSFMQFRSNLVFRWEYKLGSTLYVVWSHDRSGFESVYHPVRDIVGDLFGIEGNHVFMVKLNFWFSV